MSDDTRSEISRVMALNDRATFDILQLDIVTCTIQDVKTSYRKKAILLHPDKCPEDLKKEGQDAFARLEKAYSQVKEEAVLKRFKDAEVRRIEKAAEAARQRAAAASGGGKSSRAEIDAEEARKQERYLEAVRLEHERESKRRRTEKEDAAKQKLYHDLEEQSEAWRLAQNLLGGGGGPAGRK